MWGGGEILLALRFDIWSTREPKADHKVLTNIAVWFIICKNKSLFDNLYLEIIPCYLLNSIDFSHFQGVFSSNLGVTTRSNLMHNRWTKLDLFEDWLRFSIDSFCLSASCTMRGSTLPPRGGRVPPL